jgi:ATP:ADP antiporter, AAA family
MAARGLERFGIRQGELSAAAAAFALFFLILCSYYILRPIRDELSTRNPGELQWLFTGTFILSIVTVPLFGYAASRFSRRVLLPVVFAFITCNVLAFYLVFRTLGFAGIPSYAFFIWLSVYNLTVISIMWSFFNDVFQHERARRLYGFIAAGGSIGAITGPILTVVLVKHLGAVNLMLISAALMLLAMPLAIYLSLWGRTSTQQPTEPIPGSMWSGVRLALTSPYLLKIAVVLLAVAFLNTVLYFEQAAILARHVPDSAQRTQILAAIDFAVNGLALLLEFTAVGPLLTRFSAPKVLTTLFILNTVGFLVLGAVPLIAALVIFQVFRRSTDYAFVRPVREILFTVVSPEENYKAKNFLDVVVFRGGDAASGWAIAGLRALFSVSQIAILAVPVAAGAAWVAYSLRQRTQPQEPSLEAQHVDVA